MKRRNSGYSNMFQYYYYLLYFIESVPLHKVNYHDVFGQICGLRPRRRVPCLPLCVKNINDCPIELKPICPSGLTFCPDGTCLSTCKDTINICTCGIDKGVDAAEFMPCKLDKTINIKQYNATIKSELIKEQCSAELEIDELPLWKPDLDLPISNYWPICPEQKKKKFTYKEPMFISVFSLVSIQVSVLVLWSLYKLAREKGVQSMTASENSFSTKPTNTITEKGDLEKMNEMITSEDSFLVKGFRNDLFGSFSLLFLILFSIGWVIYLAVITADYYGSINGLEFGIANSSYDLSSQMFIAVWVSTTVWFVVLNVFRSRLRNYFRIETFPLEAKFIQIEQPQSTLILLDDNSKLLKLVNSCEAWLKTNLGWNVIVTTCLLLKTKKGLKYFTYQCTRYVYSDQNSLFQPYEFHLGTTLKEIKSQNTGLTEIEANSRKELKGPNFIHVNVPSFFIALGQEFTSFFYLYQIMIMWIFYYFAYYQVGLVDTAVIIASAVVKVVVRIRSEKRIKEMAEHESKVEVFRDEKWKNISTSELVPGDIIQIENNTSMPVDAIVLSGNIVADESSLTGEPLPIRKFPLREEAATYIRSGSHKINSLFAGTNIIQSSKNSDDPFVTALVYQTATSTDKGQLIKKILFPSPISFIFDEQLKIVICILGCWGVVLFGLSLWLQQKSGTASWFYGMLCLSQILSPLLPAALVVGQSVAASRLREKKIYCVDLPRIVIAGKIQIFAFDKTGTLTKEGLEFYGGQPIVNKEFELLKDFPDTQGEFQIGITTCHAVTEVEGTKIGNPVDIEMFTATKWELVKTNDTKYMDSLKFGDKILHIIKRFEFVHVRASMSVATLDPETNHIHVFVKGSFEKLKSLVKPESIPANYDETTSKLAMEGCYVLAMAHKDLGPIDPDKVKSMERESMEDGIEMKGLIVFKNKLKPDTAGAITKLKNGSTRTIMITGDTVLTGIYIARSCTMISEQSKVYLAILENGELRWLDVDTYHGNRIYISKQDLMSKLKDVNSGDIELAMSTAEFQHLIQSHEIETLLLYIRIYARMGPQDKVDCVQLHMKRGITAMCGDGGNDCGALRAAHVGIALSESEASIVSPFSSNHRSIESCVELIRQGRAALATSFSGYKYLIMYGEIMASLKIMTFYFSVSVSNGIWILIDAFITVGLSFAVTQSKAADNLASSRPTARLLGSETMFSVLGQIIINVLFLIGGFCILYDQPFFRCNEFDPSIVDISKWYLLGDNFEAQTLAFITLFQFINAGAIYNFGYKFRANWFKNWLLILIWLTLLIVITCVLLLNPNNLGCLLRLNCGDPDVLQEIGYSVPSNTFSAYNIPSGHNVYPIYFRYLLWGYCIANMVAGILWEKLVVIGPVRDYFRKKRPLNRLQLKY